MRARRKKRGEVQKSDDCTLSFLYRPFGAFKGKKKDSLTENVYFSSNVFKNPAAR